MASRYGSARVSDGPQSARAASLRPVYLGKPGMGAPGYRDPDRYWHPPRALLGFASVPSARAAGFTCTSPRVVAPDAVCPFGCARSPPYVRLSGVEAVTKSAPRGLLKPQSPLAPARCRGAYPAPRDGSRPAGRFYGPAPAVHGRASASAFPAPLSAATIIGVLTPPPSQGENMSSHHSRSSPPPARLSGSRRCSMFPACSSLPSRTYGIVAVSSHSSSAR